MNFTKKGTKLLHIADVHNRHQGRLYYSTGKKLNNGFIKNDINTLQISDRDYLQSNIFNYKKFSFINHIRNTIDNFKPDIILFGHVDVLNEKDFYNLRSDYKNIYFSQYFVDTLDPNFEKFEDHKKRFFLKYQICDTNFITTFPKALDFIDYSKTIYIPNVCDSSIDLLENYKYKNLEYDIFFALSHGQHRGGLKKGYKDERVNFIEKLNLDNIKSNFFGITKQPVWGANFFNELSISKMGLNYNRGMPIKYYSSDRICSLIANGLLTFLQKGYSYEDFFEDKKEAVFFEDHNDLEYLIKLYANDFKKRSEVGFNGKKKYFKLFENHIVSKYMIEKILNQKISNKLSWMD
ncbi:glycosyltransferase [Candidatus Pelagibacter sp. HIMB1485]|uniref:glycosyltransferase n=1 Tax=Candidatus Pelagibacter sp. HIMB1485 TaxID=3415415 RepID=UPI003F828620